LDEGRSNFPWLDPSLPIADCVTALLSEVTVFPSGPALAATLDVDKIRQAGVVIGKEGRAKHNDAFRSSNDGPTSTFEGKRRQNNPYISRPPF